MKISGLLAGKGSQVATIAPEATVSEAIAQMADHNVGALVVSAEAAGMDGIISERDVVRAAARAGPGVLSDPVSSIMSRNVVTCLPEDDVESVMITMTERRIRHVPVVSDGVLIGIVSIGDIVKSRIDDLESDRKALEDYINAR